MPVPFGFGLGDFLTGIQAISQIVASLRDANGSSQKFRELIRTLHAFETILRRIHLAADERLTIRTGTLSVDDANIGHTADLERLVSEGRNNIDTILKKIDTYHKLLGVDPKLYETSLKRGISGIKVAIAKVKWKVLHDDDIAVWQRELELHNNSLTSLFMTLIW